LTDVVAAAFIAGRRLFPQCIQLHGVGYYCAPFYAWSLFTLSTQWRGQACKSGGLGCC